MKLLGKIVDEKVFFSLVSVIVVFAVTVESIAVGGSGVVVVVIVVVEIGGTIVDAQSAWG